MPTRKEFTLRSSSSFAIFTVFVVVLSFCGCAQWNAGYELGRMNQYYKDRILSKGTEDYISYLDLQMTVYPALKGYCKDNGNPEYILPLFGSDAKFVWEERNKTVSLTAFGGIDENTGIPEKIILYRDEIRKLPPKTTEDKKDCQQKSSFGTGFAVSQNTVVTALHVVKDAKKIELCFDNRTQIPATILQQSESLDIAILQPATPLTDYLPLASEKSCDVGDKVFTFGYPVIQILGEEIKYTEGAINSMSGIGDEKTLIQTSIPIQPGNSGSPLINANGEVVGMLTSSAAFSSFIKATGTLPQNVNWAVKAEYISLLLNGKHHAGIPRYTSRKEMLDKTRAAVCLILADRSKAHAE